MVRWTIVARCRKFTQVHAIALCWGLACFLRGSFSRFFDKYMRLWSGVFCRQRVREGEIRFWSLHYGSYSLVIGSCLSLWITTIQRAKIRQRFTIMSWFSLVSSWPESSSLASSSLRHLAEFNKCSAIWNPACIYYSRKGCPWWPWSFS